MVMNRDLLTRFPQRLLDKLCDQAGIAFEITEVTVVHRIDPCAIVEHEVELIAEVGSVFAAATLDDELQCDGVVEDRRVKKILGL